MDAIRLALAQINPTVGDIEGNEALIIKSIEEAREAGAHIVALPELALTGYPPEDLLLKPRFIEDNMAAIGRIARAAQGIVAVVGFVDRDEDIYNAAAIMAGGAIVDVCHKIHLPNYGVFDEHRYFKAGGGIAVYELNGLKFGVNICEDIWFPEGPARAQAIGGARLIININASPYTLGKDAFRRNMLVTRATDSAVAIAYVNTVGGQDEILFDGGSMVMDESGTLIARAAYFKPQMLLCEVNTKGVFIKRLHDTRRRSLPGSASRLVNLPPVTPKDAAFSNAIAPGPECPEHEVYEALVLGVRDYITKNNFKGAIIGLSGGIDSALVAAIAADALGAENVRTVFMPSRYSSSESREDAEALARSIGVQHDEISIEQAFDAYLDTLAPVFKGAKPDTTEENLQARIRGNILMAISNKTGRIVLTTGNKSEMSVGYATLYGDMAGGFAVIKDVPKTLVFAIARWLNHRAGRELIPSRIITKPPTAELRPNQKDTDSLPPYDQLDPVLKAYIEEEKSLSEIVEAGIAPRDVASRVIGMVDYSEYKRRQSPPGIKITPRAFGRDWRVPITNRYKSSK